MNKNTRIGLIVVIVAAAYIASVWYVGKRAQTTIYDTVSQANARLKDMPGAGLDSAEVTLAIAQYQRHLFSSDVVYRLQISDDDGQTTEYLLADHLQHGPFPLSALASGFFAPILVESQATLLPSAATQPWFDSLDGRSPITGSTRIGFDGAGQSSWSLNPLNVSDEEHSVEFSGGTVDVQFSRDFARSTSRGEFTSVVYQDLNDDAIIALRDVTFEGKSVTDAESKVVSVHNEFAARQIELKTGGTQILAFEQFAVHLNGEQHKNILNADLRYEIERVLVSEADLGRLSAELSTRNLDTAALSEFVLQYDAASNRPSAVPGNDERGFEMNGALQEKLTVFLATNPSMAIDSLVWRNSEGESTTRIAVALQRPALPAATMSINDLAHVIKSVSVQIDISKPMFVKAYTQLLEPSVGTDAASEHGGQLFDQWADKFKHVGLIGGDANKAEATITYEGDEVNVNGTKMSPVQLMQRGFMALL